MRRSLRKGKKFSILASKEGGSSYQKTSNGNNVNLNGLAGDYEIFGNLDKMPKLLSGYFELFKLYFKELYLYMAKVLHISFIKFESGKSIFATLLYRQRGRYAKRFIHSGMAGLAAVGVFIAPIVADEFPGTNLDPWDIPSSTSVLSASVEKTGISTDISAKTRDKIIEYEVQSGDTISSIAEKFGISSDAVLWQNDLSVYTFPTEWYQGHNHHRF
ncbi:LysM peptidoglycan-binding domain-containing protein [Patescibacteria group bacterium]